MSVFVQRIAEYLKGYIEKYKIVKMLFFQDLMVVSLKLYLILRLNCRLPMGQNINIASHGRPKNISQARGSGKTKKN